jgi:photosystem II stability/assembly factor-like uncharacterized protein
MNMKPRQTVEAATTVLITLLAASLAFYVTSPRLHATTAAVVASPAASPSPSRPPVTAKPTLPPPLLSPSPLPGRFSVVGFDMVDSTHAWLLASDCPLFDAPTCRYEVAHSQDGGRTWARPVFVGPSIATAGLGGNRSIKFANDKDGFVYNEVGAFVTHDGGFTWTSVNVPFTFIGPFGVGGGKAWLVTYPCPKGTACAYNLRSSDDGGRTWSDPAPLPSGFSAERIDAFPGGAMLAENSQPFGFQVTTDGGRTWRAASAPCPTTTFHGAAASPDGIELWAACYPLDQGVMAAASTVWVSENGGSSWVSRKLESVANSVFVSPRPQVLFSGSASAETRVSRDGGVSWDQVHLADGPAHFAAMRFVNADFGWATDGFGLVWTTTDGGLTWTAGPSMPQTIR